jgi:hypothetical protein
MSGLIENSDDVSTGDNEVYLDEQHYTGWWPDSYQAGQGIAITDGETFQGEFQPMSGFPNGG